MSRLSTLRTQLSLLRQARWFVRLSVAVSAFLIAALWALVGILVLDLLFELPPPQRVVVMAIAAGLVIWAGVRFTWPMLQVHETVEDMALLVERQQKIDSDLIAALQFEQPEASNWGSRQLEGAVIDYVAHVGSSLNVFEGFSRAQMLRRGTVLAATLIVLLVAAVLFPLYASTFFDRLLLGGQHYPTATTIEQILINQHTVLDNHAAIALGQPGDSAPRSIKAAQGRPLEFAILTVGKSPEEKTVTLIATGVTRTRTQIELVAATREDRLNRLRRAGDLLKAAAQSDEIDTSVNWRAQVAQLLFADAREVALNLEQEQGRAELGKLADEINELLAGKSPLQDHKVLLTGQLPRLLESVRYSLVTGDAWTESAVITMIPLPAVEPALNVVPPAYAKQTAKPEPGQRQVEVLQGSALELGIACTNGKELQSAWVNIRRREETERFDLSRLPPGQDNLPRWGLVDQLGKTPLKNIREEFRYEVQVIDADGLSLEIPIRGAVRIKADRPPAAAADVVHKVVLPTAEPVIHYRATDDYGLSSIKLVTEVERHSDQKIAAASPEESAQSSTSTPGAAIAVEKQEFPVHVAKEPIGADRLPLDSTFTLSLSPLKLTKGDRLKITLEVVDYRGENETGEPTGQLYQSDPLVLEISDESGVLAAISEADERSEQRLTDIIKRQLGIGESP
jgi:hypothetical protein